MLNSNITTYVIDPRCPGDIATCYSAPGKALDELAGKRSMVLKRWSESLGIGRRKPRKDIDK